MRFKVTRFQELPPASRGLGDAIARIAKPIARVIDRAIGTRLQDCDPCEKRRVWLNEHFRL
jgi:hypothetical protein